ncbi:MAG: 2-oxoacid ferredoxin oxidoreductase [Myxococcales bacterium]|nr:2-oxoacid ferredoxin oxidoreductase [Myxococcales bacterium]
MSVRKEDYESPVENHWCPGCGNFGILNAVRRALVELELAPHQVLICSGIGQAPKLPHYLRVNTMNGLHGREVAVATAAKLCAPDLCVLVHAGDGGAYGEGGNHLLHAIRRDVDITLVVHDNKVYGLTKGQASPTTSLGEPAKIHPRGVPSRPLNPLALAIALECGFVAQALSSRTDLMTDILKRAVRHRGFSLVNVLQPCVSWDKVRTYAFYDQHCAPVPPEHDAGDAVAAFRLATSRPFLLGVFFERQGTPFDERVLPQGSGPLRDLPVEPRRAEHIARRFR